MDRTKQNEQLTAAHFELRDKRGERKVKVANCRHYRQFAISVFRNTIAKNVLLSLLFSDKKTRPKNGLAFCYLFIFSSQIRPMSIAS